MKYNYKYKNFITYLVLLNSIILGTYAISAIKGELYEILSPFFAQVSNHEGATHKMNGKISLAIGRVNAVGSTYSINSKGVKQIQAPKLHLHDAHVFPNPCRVYNGDNKITFTDITKTATIKIFTISGKLVKRLEKDSYSEDIEWDLRNGNNQEVASGVYLYIIKNSQMNRKGKLVVIR
ncbi:MAG: T9SS type A sorting domain-containing protein [bacterium]|nr:T9SS type A sorting domain-containing protein [bacterium]